MKKIFAFLLLAISVFSFAACNKNNNGGNGDGDGNGDGEVYKGLPRDYSATLDILLWNGDGEYHQDIGSKNWKPEDITGQNVAAIYAVAKAFKTKFPNIKINVLARKHGPEAHADNDGRTFEQEIQYFKDEHNKYPDIWTSDNVSRDLTQGLLMDLSMFSDDPLYKKLNPALLSMTSYFGFQAALPQYSLPWGIMVNKDLAEGNNIHVPGFDWTWSDYVGFLSSAKPGSSNAFYGEWDTAMTIIRRALIESQLQNRGENADTFVDLDIDAFKGAVSLLPKIQTVQVPETDKASVGNNYGPTGFRNQKLLTLHNYPWHIGDSFVSTSGFDLKFDFDVYPLPSFGEAGENTVGAVLDPVVVYNYCAQDGKKECSNAELDRAKAAYTFTSFWTASEESLRSRVEQKFSVVLDGKSTLRSAMNDSFPIVTGDEFKKQLDIWFEMENHKPFKDEEKFPGFHQVIKLWEEGKITSVSDKAYPLTYKDSSGTVVDCLQYINGFWDAGVVGAGITEENWYNTYIAGISEWNEKTNERFTTAFQKIRTALDEHYVIKK